MSGSAFFGLGALAVTAAATAGISMLRRQIAIVAVVGPSMQPTLSAGDRVLVRRAAISDLRAGQIVVFEQPDVDGLWATGPLRWPANGRSWMIKRVAAIPGDALPEVMPHSAEISDESVPPGHLVVLGDNIGHSKDSRAIGYVPADRLLGVMVRPLRGGGRAGRARRRVATWLAGNALPR